MLKTFKHPKYTYTKNGIYYFSIAVPSDLERNYSRKRITQSLRTKSKDKARKSAQILASRLHDYWFQVRLQCTTPPLAELLKASPITSSESIDAQQSLALYIDVKGSKRNDMFAKNAARNISYLIDCAGNKPITEYSLKDATSLRDSLLRRLLSSASIHRIFGSIKAVFNFAISETGIDTKNPFSGIYLPPEQGKKRKPLSTHQLNIVKRKCFEMDDDVRWLVALISDTGMRLSEATGLLISDIQLDDKYPHLIIQPHPHRQLKTASSERIIPLVGASLWAANRLLETSSSNPLCFPRYASLHKVNSNSASAAINKWLKTFTDNDVVIHGMRHSFRDRLRAVEAPLEVIDQLGGWSRKTVGQGYGDGYPLEHLNKWMEMISPLSHV